MKRIRKCWRETLRPLWYDYEWPVVGALALAVVALGARGFHLHRGGASGAIDLVDLVFKSCQLFVLQVGVDPPMPWQLNVARILAPLVAAYTALQALAELFAGQMRSLRLRFLRGHVVVCGLGRKGLSLARGFLDLGYRVVVIERDAENDLVRQCRDLGAMVLIGDATEPWLLRKAGVRRAGHLFALCGDDGVNAEIAVQSALLIQGRPGPPLKCVLHIFDPRLCALLRERELGDGSAGRLRLEFFNVYDLGARVLLEENPLDGGGGKGGAGDPLVIVGLGRLGESLLVNAARQWQAAGRPERGKLRVTLVDREAKEIARTLQVRYPGLNSTCEFTALDLDVTSGSFQRADFLAPREDGTGPARVFVCLDDDSLGLSAALALVSQPRTRNPTIVVRMSQDAGLAVLLRDVDRGLGSFRHLRAFGLLDRACHPKQVLRGTHEILARSIHEEYLRQQAAAGVRPEDNPSMAPWDSLPEHLREANRQQADDIGCKLRAVRCTAAPQLDWAEPLFEFTAEEVERLARMEHERWMAAKIRDGWRYGPRKDAGSRTHPCLVPYDRLSADEQEKDRSAVRLIPATLAKVGFRVHRSAPRTDAEG